MPRRADAPARRPSASVRVRVLCGLLLLMALALGITGAAVYALQIASATERTDATLRQSADRVRSLADDPQAAQGTEELLYAALQQTLPAPDEGMVALYDAKVLWEAPEQYPLRLEGDPELLAWAARGDGTVRLETVRTSHSTYRAVGVPVSAKGASGTGSSRGTVLFAFDLDAQRGRIAADMGPFAAVAGAALLVTGVVGWLVVGRLLHPLRLLGATARRITDTDLDERIPVNGRDDLAELTVTVNQMLDRVQGAVESQRRLLDDAGHELRTPIAVVRGHLELMDATDPGEVAEAREVALDELDRMTVLVNDLVVLAQSGQDRFVSPQTVEVEGLMAEIAGKASALGARRWEAPRAQPGTARLDRRRITQAMLQLAHNAVKFSPEGSRITLSAELDAHRLRLWVADEGPGIPEAERSRVLQRFARGAAATRLDGAGLGLAIVEAIARAHGGKVVIGDAPDGGALVGMDLPRDAGSDREDASRRTPFHQDDGDERGGRP